MSNADKNYNDENWTWNFSNMKVSANEIKTYAMSRNQTTKANQLWNPFGLVTVKDKWS